jgi:hypothetical protein
MEGLTLVGLFMEGTTLTCLETYSDAKKRTLVSTLVLVTPSINQVTLVYWFAFSTVLCI